MHEVVIESVVRGPFHRRIKAGFIIHKPTDRSCIDGGNYFWSLVDRVHDWFVSNDIPYELDYDTIRKVWFVIVARTDHALLTKLTWGGR